MSRVVAMLAALGIAVTGCTMCPDPFDYSGPVPNGSAPQNDFRLRSNGILPLGRAPRPWPPVVKAMHDSPVAPPVAEEVAPDVELTSGEADSSDALPPTEDALTDR
ncbi:MAG: hypothetical protein ACKOEX_08215 [Planctomycetia bacterium]